MKKFATQVITFLACAVVACVTAFAAPEKAPDAETAAAVKELMETLKVKEQMGPAIEGMKKMQSAMLDQQDLSDDEKAAAKEIMAASMEEVEKLLSWDSLEKMMVRAYVSVFTKEEVEGLTALFKTPAGQKFVEKQPQLQAATMRELQTIMVDLMPKIQEKTKAAIERVKNRPPQN